MIDDTATERTGSVVWKERTIQGAKYDSLCGPCNNNTGSWYNTAYIRVVRSGGKLAKAKAAGATCRMSILTPQRVAKSALVSVVATSQPGLTARYPAIRTLLLDREARGSIAPLRLGFYLQANKGGTSTGLTTTLDIDQKRAHIAAGFSFWPLGWLMTIDAPVAAGTLDVSEWFELGYMERGPVAADVPCQIALTGYPGDFRRPGEPDRAPPEIV